MRQNTSTAFASSYLQVGWNDRERKQNVEDSLSDAVTLQALRLPI